MGVTIKRDLCGDRNVLYLDHINVHILVVLLYTISHLGVADVTTGETA